MNTTVAPTAIDQKEESKSSMTVGIVITNRIFYPSDLVNAKTTKPGPSGSVKSGGYIPRRFASRYISTTIHLPFGG